jgi:sigma-B regulation protein RsbU (phosphoserine phosphatase)
MRFFVREMRLDFDTAQLPFSSTRELTVANSELEEEPRCDKVKGTMHVSRSLRQTNQTSRSLPRGLQLAALPRLALRLSLILALAASVASAQVPPDTAASHPHTPPSGVPIPNPNAHPPKGQVSAPDTPVVFDATGMGSPLVLDSNWRLGITHDTEPAKPDFDDSKWPVRNAKEALADIDDSAADEDGDKHSGHGHGPPDHRPQPSNHSFVWFRLRIQLPAHHGPIALLVRVPVTRNAQTSITETVGMDLFANGNRIDPEGSSSSTPETYQQITRVYPIDIPENEQNLTLAARIPYAAFGIDAYTGFFAHRTFFLGARDDLRSHLDLWNHAMLFERLPALVDAGLKTLLAIFLLALFWAQKDHLEYLWLGLQMLTVAPLAYVGMTGSMGHMEQRPMFALMTQIVLISAYFYFEFLVSFLALRKRWYILGLRYSAPILLTFAPLLLFIHESKAIAIGWVLSAMLATLWMAAWVVFVALTLTIAAIKRNYEAALLLLPLLLSVVGMVELISTAGSSSWLGTPIQSPLSFEAGPIPIHFSDFADFVGIFVIIFVRFLRIHRERERASSELAAARSVQELMIPRESPQTPGFHVDTVYTPATEVGGDFFHIEATGNGGLLVVIGDVAGHGLQAAMNVSMLMGALRRSPDIEPARLLAGLNQVLVGSSSFTTCQAAYFYANGELVIASAGHPPPYLNSQEVTLPGGLPLGVVSGVVYEEVRLYLHPGDRLLMMSDGVAEARKPSGELFGFDRVRNLSNQTPFFIADAAKDFGQEDDITVLTVRRLVQAAVA